MRVERRTSRYEGEGTGAQSCVRTCLVTTRRRGGLLSVDRCLLPPLISAEEVAGIDFGLDVVEDGVVAVGNDGLGALLEVFQIVYHTTTEEGGAVLKSGFVDNNFCSLGLDALHDTLNGALTEIVGVGLHGETEDADGGGGV